MYAFTAGSRSDFTAKLGEVYPKNWRKSVSRDSLGFKNVIAPRYTVAKIWLTDPREYANAEHILVL